MRAALDRPGTLWLATQPIVDLATGAVAGYEALARLSGGHDVPPDRLFEAAGRLGLSDELQAVVCGAAVKLLGALPADTFLTVNVDPGHLASPVAVAPLLGEGSLTRLVVEVTERAWPDGTAAVDATLQRLAAKGALVAADDVGAGYAGLSQLMRLRPQMVKLDRGLVDGLGRDPAAELLVEAVGSLCSHLDAWVIVEGVEREEQLATLSRLGVPLGQGWLLGRPALPWPEGAATDLVRRRASMAALDDAIAPLIRRDAVAHHRDATGSYWLVTADGAAPATVMAPSTPIADALLRVVARTADQRWWPVLVTDVTGGVIGHVTIEDLVTASVRGRRNAAAAPLPVA